MNRDFSGACLYASQMVNNLDAQLWKVGKTNNLSVRHGVAARQGRKFDFTIPSVPTELGLALHEWSVQQFGAVPTFPQMRMVREDNPTSGVNGLGVVEGSTEVRKINRDFLKVVAPPPTLEPISIRSSAGRLNSCKRAGDSSVHSEAFRSFTRSSRL